MVLRTWFGTLRFASLGLAGTLAPTRTCESWKLSSLSQAGGGTLLPVLRSRVCRHLRVKLGEYVGSGRFMLSCGVCSFCRRGALVERCLRGGIVAGCVSTLAQDQADEVAHGVSVGGGEALKLLVRICGEEKADWSHFRGRRCNRRRG